MMKTRQSTRGRITSLLLILAMLMSTFVTVMPVTVFAEATREQIGESLDLSAVNERTDYYSGNTKVAEWWPNPGKNYYTLKLFGGCNLPGGIMLPGASDEENAPTVAIMLDSSTPGPVTIGSGNADYGISSGNCKLVIGSANGAEILMTVQGEGGAINVKASETPATPEPANGREIELEYPHPAGSPRRYVHLKTDSEDIYFPDFQIMNNFGYGYDYFFYGHDTKSVNIEYGVAAEGEKILTVINGTGSGIYGSDVQTANIVSTVEESAEGVFNHWILGSVLSSGGSTKASVNRNANATLKFNDAVCAVAEPSIGHVKGWDYPYFSNNSSDFFNVGEPQNYNAGSYFDNFSRALRKLGYSISEAQYYLDMIKTQMNWNWGGSCFGFAAVEGMYNTGSLDINDYDEDATGLYDTDFPRDDTDVRNLLNYYFLTQFIPAINPEKQIMRDYAGKRGWNVAGTTQDGNQSILEIAKELTSNEAEEKHYMFSYFFEIEGNIYGHAVTLESGYYNEQDNIYELTAFDNRFHGYVWRDSGLPVTVPLVIKVGDNGIVEEARFSLPEYGIDEKIIAFEPINDYSDFASIIPVSSKWWAETVVRGDPAFYFMPAFSAEGSSDNSDSKGLNGISVKTGEDEEIIDGYDVNFLKGEGSTVKNFSWSKAAVLTDDIADKLAENPDIRDTVKTVTDGAVNMPSGIMAELNEPADRIIASASESVSAMSSRSGSGVSGYMSYIHQDDYAAADIKGSASSVELDLTTDSVEITGNTGDFTASVQNGSYVANVSGSAPGNITVAPTPEGAAITGPAGEYTVQFTPDGDFTRTVTRTVTISQEAASAGTPVEVPAEVDDTPPGNNGGGGGGGSSAPSAYTVTVPEDISGGTVAIDPEKAKKGETVTVTVTPDEGYELESLTVLDKNGNEIEVTEESDGTYTFVMPSGKVEIDVSFKEIVEEPEQPELPTEPAWENPFTDVNESDWYYEAVKYMNQTNLMKGVEDNMFGPGTNLTRAMLVTILYRMAGEPAAGQQNAFSDVPAGSYYEAAVAWGYETGVVQGITETEFGSDMNITREQLATMLWRYAGSPASAHSLAAFTDAGQISDFAQQAMAWANEVGIIRGKGDGILDPGGNATRAEVAQMIMNYIEATKA